MAMFSMTVHVKYWLNLNKARTNLMNDLPTRCIPGEFIYQFVHESGYDGHIAK